MIVLAGHTYSIKTNIFLFFFFQETIENIEKCAKKHFTISGRHTYKLTFVFFVCFFILHLSLSDLEI